MFCARCDDPILPDEPSETHDVLSPTGPGATVTIHARHCKQPPRQTYPRPTSPSGFDAR